MNIPLSQKHGVNPSLMQCYFCGKEKGIALLGRLPNDKEAPRRGVYDTEPCDDCRKMMEVGVLRVECKTGSDPKNPYRTGRIFCIKQDVAKAVFDNIGENRVVFIDEEAVAMMGLDKIKPVFTDIKELPLNLPAEGGTNADVKG